MDILHLVDRLEELFNESRHIPLTSQVVVDEYRMFEIIDQMRVSIPDAVKGAREVLAKRDRILAQAQEEAARTVDLSRKKGIELIERDSVMLGARARADQVLEQARVEMETMRRNADNYVLDSLRDLEAELERLIAQARNGIARLENQRGPSADDEAGD